jgi:hypothetical protein
MTSSLERRLAKLEPPPAPMQAEWRRIIAQPEDEPAVTQRRVDELRTQGFSVIVRQIIFPAHKSNAHGDPRGSLPGQITGCDALA